MEKSNLLDAIFNMSSPNDQINRRFDNLTGG